MVTVKAVSADCSCWREGFQSAAPVAWKLRPVSPRVDLLDAIGILNHYGSSRNVYVSYMPLESYTHYGSSRNGYVCYVPLESYTHYGSSLNVQDVYLPT